MHRLLTSLLLACTLLPFHARAKEVTDVPYAKAYVAGAPDDAQWTLTDLHLDILEPRGLPAAPRPAIVMMHGGGFDHGSKDNRRLNRLAAELVEQGYVCFLANYRLMKDNAPAPGEWGANQLFRAMHAAFVDTKAAIRFVRAHAREYYVDPRRVAVCGESAGAFAAIAAGISDPGVFVHDRDDYPQPSFNHLDQNDRPNAVVNLWGSAERVKHMLDAQDPPIMTVHGRKDANIGTFFQFAEAFARLCEEKDVRHRFYVSDEDGHGAWNVEHNGRGLAQLIHDFLQEEMRP